MGLFEKACYVLGYFSVSVVWLVIPVLDRDLVIGMADAECVSNSTCFCERAFPPTGVRIQGTYSNYAYLLAALTILRFGFWHSAGATLLYVMSLLVLAFGSALYHATFTRFGELVDFTGMYLLATYIYVWQYQRWFTNRVSIRPAICFQIVCVVLLSALQYLWISSINRILFGLIVLIGYTIELVEIIRKRRRGLLLRWFVMFTALYICAMVLWIVDSFLSL